MDAYEFNKIAGWVLGALLFTLGMGFFSGAIFAAKKPAVAGYALPAEEEKAAGPTAAVTIPLPELLAKADDKKGVAEARQCQTCHIFTEQGEKKPGPTLYGIVNRKIAAADFPGYSTGMKEFAAAHPVWDYDILDKFLANPKGVVKNTAMQFAGVNNAEKRANLIAYLRMLAKEPAPLPGK